MTIATSTPLFTRPATVPRGMADSGAPQAGVASELIQTHLRAGQLVAELSASPVWARADRLVARLVTDAEEIAAARLGRSPVPTATGSVPAVVRCRELAMAQRKLRAAIEAPGWPVGLDATVVRTRALVAELAEIGR